MPAMPSSLLPAMPSVLLPTSILPISCAGNMTTHPLTPRPSLLRSAARRRPGSLGRLFAAAAWEGRGGQAGERRREERRGGEVRSSPVIRGGLRVSWHAAMRCDGVAWRGVAVRYCRSASTRAVRVLPNPAIRDPRLCSLPYFPLRSTFFYITRPYPVSSTRRGRTEPEWPARRRGTATPYTPSPASPRRPLSTSRRHRPPGSARADLIHQQQ